MLQVMYGNVISGYPLLLQADMMSQLPYQQFISIGPTKPFTELFKLCDIVAVSNVQIPFHLTSSYHALTPKTSHRHHRFLKIFVYVSRLDFYPRLSWWKAAKDPSTHIEIKQLILFDLSKPNIFRFLEGTVIFETSKQALKNKHTIYIYTHLWLMFRVLVLTSKHWTQHVAVKPMWTRVSRPFFPRQVYPMRPGQDGTFPIEFGNYRIWSDLINKKTSWTKLSDFQRFPCKGQLQVCHAQVLKVFNSCDLRYQIKMQHAGIKEIYLTGLPTLRSYPVQPRT